VLLTLSVYAAVLLAAPVLHHDFACHRNTPAHCPACAASPPAPRTMPYVQVALDALPDAGGIDMPSREVRSATGVLRLPGRSPPALDS